MYEQREREENKIEKLKVNKDREREMEKTPMLKN